MSELPTFEQVEYHRAAMWRERDRVAAEVGAIFRVCSLCGWDCVGVSAAAADEKVAGHLEAMHGEKETA